MHLAVPLGAMLRSIPVWVLRCFTVVGLKLLKDWLKTSSELVVSSVFVLR